MTDRPERPDDTTQPSGVIDLVPMIRARQSSQCPHLHVEVDDTIASLTCVECGSEIDPWWYLRSQGQRLAQWEAYQERIRLESAAIQKRHEAWQRQAQESADKLTAEINRLHALKWSLLQEPVGGTTLGQIARTGARRKR